MAYQFRPGQKVRFIGENGLGKVAQNGDIGEFVTYTPAPKNIIERAIFLHYSDPAKNIVLVETRFNNRRWICATSELIPVDDGAEGSTWENCVWNPNKNKVEA
jgi:hypothetical protein